MDLGVSTLLWYQEEDLVPHLPLLEEEGIRLIEIRRCPHHLDYADGDRTARLSAALRKHGVVIHSLHVPDTLCIDIAAPDVATRDAAVREIRMIADALADIGGKILVIHAGGVIEEECERPARLETSHRSLSEIAAFCGPLRLKVAVENSLPTKKRVGDTVAEVVALVDRIGAGNLGVCLDTSHANIGEDVVRAVGLVGGRLLHLHISDNDGRQDEHALPFEGSINWQGFMAALGTTRYDGAFMLEVRGGTDPPQIVREVQGRYRRLTAMAASG